MAPRRSNWLSEIYIPVYLLIMVFNMASWIDLNAVWVETPLLVNRLPEGWNLPSYFTVIIACAKMGLVTYVTVKYYLGDRLPEWPFVYVIIGVGSICMFTLGFVWEKTTFVFGEEHSLHLFVVTAVLSFVDSMSSAVFLPYMDRYKAQYITAFFVGEGLCQITPAIASMIQGVGETPDCVNQTTVYFNETAGINHTMTQITAIFPEPKYSVKAFFIFMFCIMVCSGIAFTCLHFWPHCKRHQLHERRSRKATCKTYKTVNNFVLDQGESHQLTNGIKIELSSNLPSPEICHTTMDNSMEKLDDSYRSTEAKSAECKMSRCEFGFCMAILIWSFGLMYGINPSIQPYACLPYSNRAFNLSIRLGLAMNPIVSFLALFVSTKSKSVIGLINLVGTLCCTYQIYLAIMSPFPPMKGTIIGEVLVILTFVTMMACFNYSRSCIIYKLKDAGGENALMFGGGAMHIGGTTGAILIFLIINRMQPFKSEPVCPGM